MLAFFIMATDLQKLRALARKKHESATAKVSRLKQQGVKLSQTQYDPRVKKQNINRYTKKQLESYINKIDDFTNRKTQYVAGMGGAPIPKEDYISFQRAQTAANIKAEKYIKPHEHRILPTTNVSIGQRLNDLEAKEFNIFRMGKGTQSTPFQTSQQTAKDFYDVKAMRAAEKSMRRKIEPNFLSRKIKNYRRVANEMLKTVGDQEMVKKLNSLNDKEFDLLWNLTSFPSGLKLNYENIKTGVSAKWAQEVAHDQMLESRELFEWVQTQEL